jgi:phage terminase large subunit-like protein
LSDWDLSCRDWESRLREGRSLVPELPDLDRAAGDRAVAVLDRLRLSDVTGTPTFGEAGGEWFRDIVRALFGSWDSAAAVRHIVELFLLIPKKNSKTTDGALLMLTALLLNERPRAPFALMAPVQDTAEEAFAVAEGAIALDPVLERNSTSAAT